MLLRSCSPTLALSSRLARVGALLALCAMVTSTTGCFGTFPLTKTIYRENQEISNVEFHQTLAYWVMVLTLVYPGALLTDTIVMNTIEFWKPEPTSWEASGVFIPAPADGYEAPAAVSAPIGSTVKWMDVPAAPAATSPGLDAPSLTAPGIDAPSLNAPGLPAPTGASPTVPLPLPPLEPIFEEAAAASPSLALSQAPGGYVSP